MPACSTQSIAGTLSPSVSYRSVAMSRQLQLSFLLLSSSPGSFDEPGLSLKKCRGGGGQPDYSLWTSAAAVLNCISHTCCRYRHGCAHVPNPALLAFPSSIQSIPRHWREAFRVAAFSELSAHLPVGTSLAGAYRYIRCLWPIPEHPKILGGFLTVGFGLSLPLGILRAHPTSGTCRRAG